MGLFNRKKVEVGFNPNATKTQRTEYICTYCGHKETRKSSMGRPMPGKCPRRNGNQPHRWVINRKY